MTSFIQKYRDELWWEIYWIVEAMMDQEGPTTDLYVLNAKYSVLSKVWNDLGSVLEGGEQV
ncbi:hypothetical protein [Paenibacillus wenxiniae]|uniref:Uncharacterized protein n=1 Tax=Paenibacillus wenxiniae TaxID=1636843 RepID=A0ABW4RE91_9BACL